MRFSGSDLEEVLEKALVEALVGLKAVAKRGLGGLQMSICASVKSFTLPTREWDRVVWLRSLYWVGCKWEEGSQRVSCERMALKAFVVLLW